MTLLELLKVALNVLVSFARLGPFSKDWFSLRLEVGKTGSLRTRIVEFIVDGIVFLLYFGVIPLLLFGSENGLRNMN